MGSLGSILAAFLIFFLNVVEALIKWLFYRSPRHEARHPHHGTQRPPSPHRRLTPREQVLELERIRRHRGYKSGWLYYRCQELGLEDTLRDLRKEKIVA